MNLQPRINDLSVRPGEVEAASTEPTLQDLKSLVADLGRTRYLFRLYVSGTSSRSAQAIANVRRICDQRLAGHYDLEVVDIYQQPAATRAAQVIAVPTLIKELPPPSQRVVGDMSDTERIIIRLNLEQSNGGD